MTEIVSGQRLPGAAARRDEAVPARPSTDRAAMPRLSRGEQESVQSAAMVEAHAARPLAVALELRTPASLAPQPGVVWRSGARRPAARGAGADESVGDARLVGPQAVTATAPRAAAETFGAQAGATDHRREAQTASAADAGQIAEQVMRHISRHLVVERERRGLRN